MSTATPPASTSAAHPSGARPGTPQRVPVNAPASPAAAAGALGNIDPIRLLRRYWLLLVAAAFMGAVLGTAAHFAWLRIAPMYTSAAVFECRPPTTRTTSLDTANIQQADFDRFMGTQMQIMTSERVLEMALDNSELTSTSWAQQFVVNGNFQKTKALTALKKKLSSRIINQTTLIQLSMTWKNKDEVRAIVNAVASAYRQTLSGNERAQSSDRREVLTRRKNDINDRVKLLNRNRDDILKEGGLTSIRQNADEADKAIATISEELVASQQKFSELGSLLKRLDEARSASGVTSFPDDMQLEAKRDPVVYNLDQELSQLRVDEATLIARGFDSNHDAVQAVRRRIEAAKNERQSALREALDRLYNDRRETLQSTIDSTKASLEKLDSELNEKEARKRDLLKHILRIDQIETELKELNDELLEVKRAHDELDALSQYDVFNRVQLVGPPQVPNEVTFPKLAVMVPLGVLLLTGLTASVVLLRELMDQRVKGPADVAMIPRLRVLGMIPDASEDPSRPGSVETAFRDTPGGVVTESFRQVRAPLVSKLDAEGLRTVLILAGMPGSGGTTVAANLALACAGADERVLLIDANFRRPAVHRVLGAGESLGLADCLAGQTTLAESARPSGVANLTVLTAGSAGNRMLPERLSSEAMNRILVEAAARYDRVFIDAPPAIVSGDGLAIANKCDAVVMVVRALSEKRGLVNRIRTQLAGTRAELVGVVVNGVKSSAGGYFKRNIQATHEYHNTGRT